MHEAPTIDAELTLLRTDDGGRHSPVYAGYRPHVVVGDPTQREASVRDGDVLTEEYLGVTFLDGPEVIQPSDSCMVTMSLMYYPNVDYSGLLPGRTFTLREGGRIVGFGRVIKRSDV